MLRLAKFTLDEIIPLIGAARRWAYSLSDGRKVWVGTDSVRLKLHKRCGHCVACFLRSEHFWLEVDIPKSHRKLNLPVETYCADALSKRAHLNPYGIGQQGQEVLMTLDHIHPRSKGGPKEDSNIQVLCRDCNRIKANKFLTPVQILEQRCNGNPAFAAFVESNKELLGRELYFHVQFAEL